MHFLCLNLCFGTKGRDITCLVEDTSRIPEESAEPPAVQQVSTSSLAPTSKAKQEPQISSIPAGLPPQIEDTPKAKKEPQITSIPEGVLSQVEDTRKAKQEPQIPSIPAGLPSQVEDTLGECPRFRIILVGKSGIGKSSLIANIFNLDKDKINIAHNAAGDADIEHGYTSPENVRFILHDSKGFEAGSGGNWTKVQSFLEKRQGTDRVPVITVFTKYDILLNQFLQKNLATAERDAADYFANKIKEFGEDLKSLSIDPESISYAKVSTRETNAKG
ncbi:hypothetical protein CVT25_014619 [Psilocybe cyanescens]|uniref:G domain-containing protein n=1 Tax=Psilocybe cyanescens TaxID=93625 RepID=A0A409WUA4_PSICY|nr:hypothetical protein CVT25_014619 [Psilocybe cyanescens]